jgi:hypothetical protein
MAANVQFNRADDLFKGKMQRGCRTCRIPGAANTRAGVFAAQSNDGAAQLLSACTIQDE